ncbi:MAG: prolipoprotein diacylglyceryl transferase [Duodenibacillus sp.]|nr:prolipoprotein diacylglyceryl transferase [Duodenibacillus sp.]
MLVHPQFNPIALQIGPVAVHWYGLMYLIGFALFYHLGKQRAQDSWRGVSPRELDDLLFVGVLGVILGGRLGFCLFYQPDWFAAHPIDVFKVWQGGMSAHGGMLGVFAAILIHAAVHKKSFWVVADFVAPLVPLGLMAGRIGNFINGELWGRLCSDQLPWGMVFPQSGTFAPRHPSQLYEAGLEGLLLFIVLWGVSYKRRITGVVSMVFCLGYGIARFVVEFFREPDSYLGLGLFGLSRGQWLTIPLFVIAGLIWLAVVKPPLEDKRRRDKLLQKFLDS